MVSGPLPAAAPMERTAAAMSQCAERMRDSSCNVNDLDDSFTWHIVTSNKSGDGAAATVDSNWHYVRFLHSFLRLCTYLFISIFIIYVGRWHGFVP